MRKHLCLLLVLALLSQGCYTTTMHPKEFMLSQKDFPKKQSRYYEPLDERGHSMARLKSFTVEKDTMTGVLRSTNKPVTLPTEKITAIREREFSGTRTAFAAGSVALLGAVIALMAFLLNSLKDTPSGFPTQE